MPVSDSTSMPVPSLDQRKAAAALLRTLTPAAAELGKLFARAGHELALVGGPVRDAFLGSRPGDLDLTTDAVPAKVLAIVAKWADKTWTVCIDFGTIGLRKGDTIFEITTYRSEEYGPRSRKPDVRPGLGPVSQDTQPGRHLPFVTSETPSGPLHERVLVSQVAALIAARQREGQSVRSLAAEIDISRGAVDKLLQAFKKQGPMPEPRKNWPKLKKWR